MKIEQLPKSSQNFARMYGVARGLAHAYSYSNSFPEPFESGPELLNWRQYQSELHDARTIKQVLAIADKWNVTL